MPRQMGELRRLCLEYNSLVPLALERGIRVRPRAHFHMDRRVARQMVADLRASVAPFFAPSTGASADLGSDTFGVELEFIMPRGLTRTSLAQQLQAEGVMCLEEHYNHQTRTHWKLTTDASLGFTGAEVVSPPLSGEEGLEALRKVCRVLTRVGCKVDRKCGLHVHVGCRSRQVSFFRSLVAAYRHFEPALDSVLAPSRRGHVNGFCQPVAYNPVALAAATTVREVAAAAGQTHFDMPRSHQRYRKLNLLSFGAYGTVEFRQHQGTVEARKAEMWVRLCMRMVARATGLSDLATVHAMTRDLAGLSSFVGLSEAELQFFTERRDYFAARLQRRAA